MHRHLALALVAALSLTACHGRFKREAPALGAVSSQVFVTGGPYVELGKVYDDGVLALAVNVVQEVKGVKQAGRIAHAVDLEQVNQALHTGFSEALGEGPPFAYHPEAGHVVQLELVSYGMNVPYLGAPGEFTYDLHVRIYKDDGRRVYRSHMSCSTGVGAPSDVALVFDAVNNVKQLNEMSDQQISDSFSDVAWWCGQQLVTKMRRHAN